MPDLSSPSALGAPTPRPGSVRALDAFGHASLVLRARDGRRLWQSALARRLMSDYFAGLPEVASPPELTAWAAREALRQSAGAEPHPLTIARGTRRLNVTLHPVEPGEPDLSSDSEWLLVLREEADTARLQALALAFPALDGRAAELLLWQVDGASDEEIAARLGVSAAEVQAGVQALCRHLAVDSAAAAAALARQRLPAGSAARAAR